MTVRRAASPRAGLLCLLADARGRPARGTVEVANVRLGVDRRHVQQPEDLDLCFRRDRLVQLLDQLDGRVDVLTCGPPAESRSA